MKPSREPTLLRWIVPAALLLVLVAVSPFALDSFHGDETEWQRRSVIGQTYGAISALVAALALAALAVSVFFQWQETRAAKEFARRAIHIELLKMAIDDPELRECCHLGIVDETPSRQYLYCNLLFSFWETNYALGLLGREEVEGVAAQLLSTRPGYAFWKSAREYRHAYVDSTHARKFRQAFDMEFHRRPEPPGES